MACVHAVAEFMRQARWVKEGKGSDPDEISGQELHRQDGDRADRVPGIIGRDKGG